MKSVPFILLFIAISTIGIATFAEQTYGADFIYTYIYNTWWFASLWTAVILSAIPLIVHQRLWKKRSSIILHTGFGIIFIGAIISGFTGQKGMIHLHQGIPVGAYVNAQRQVINLPFILRLDSFQIEYHTGTTLPADYVSHVSCLHPDGKALKRETISMNHILRIQGYRFYQSSFDEDLQGSWLGVNHDPWGTSIAYIGFMVLCIGFMLTLYNRRKDFLTLHKRFPAILPCCLLLFISIPWIVYRYRMSPDAPPPVPVLNSLWLLYHVSAVLISYALLSLTFLISLWSVYYAILSIKKRTDERKKQIERLTRLNRLLLYPSTFLLGIGIILGALWANVSWGNYWSWDPKEVWALITFCTYGMAFHHRSLTFLRKDTAFHLFMIMCFSAVLMTWFGVNHLLGGLHSYGDF